MHPLCVPQSPARVERSLLSQGVASLHQVVLGNNLRSWGQADSRRVGQRLRVGRGASREPRSLLGRVGVEEVGVWASSSRGHTVGPGAL